MRADRHGPRRAKALDAEGDPPSQLDETITIATWNIRELARRPRLKASLYYIAEIIGQLDLVAIVELRGNVDDLCEVLGYLGSYWDAIYHYSITF